jgi:hypothetical protein
LKAGLRFSTKAVTPSTKSSVALQRAKAAASAASCSARLAAADRSSRRLALAHL